MKKIFPAILLQLTFLLPKAFPQSSQDTTVYLLTCGTGTETYSIYGHSALRVVINSLNSDLVYNWGVFDFDTPNFAWKFAKGRLNYMLDKEPLQRFLPIYNYEKRYVVSQKINFNAAEKRLLTELINVNLQPENINYRYDFFYDDCSTRIRDLIEKAVGATLLYPPAGKEKSPTFRSMVGKYQAPFPWLNFGIDLIMGSPGEKRASFRDRMFLPLDMKDCLSETVINREGKMVPLLQNPDSILDFEPIVIKPVLVISPLFIFTVLLICVIMLTAKVRSVKANNRVDIVIYSVYSLLAILMIFFNFFTDHQQMKWNLNILWLNPLILWCLFLVIAKKSGTIWFRTVFIISIIFLVLHFILPQAFNMAILPLVLILAVRSSVRAGYAWNPLSLKE